MKQYRITTNGKQFRIEQLCRGLLWWRWNKWKPLGRYPGVISGPFVVTLYPTYDKAKKSLQDKVDEEALSMKEWKPVIKITQNKEKK